MKQKNNNKLYSKAIKYYEEGKLEKALLQCEEAISLNLRNSAALNLKGLLLYLKGNLDEAVATWKINADFNDDKIAKNYIQDSKADYSRVKLFNEGKKYLAKLEIDEAIESFMKCRESDFNSLNVNISLAKCYFKKCDYALSSYYLIKALEIDRFNNEANNIKKSIESYSNEKVNVGNNLLDLKKVIVCIGIILIIIAVPLISKVYISSVKQKESMDEQYLNYNNMNEDTEKEDNKEESSVDLSKIDTYINEKKYLGLHNIISKVRLEDLSKEEQVLYYKGKEALEANGVDYLYKRGMESYNNKRYENAKSDMNLACIYGRENYLYPHILFFNAVIEEKLNDFDESIKFYEEYEKLFSKGEYIEEVLYKLALMYKEKDINKSIYYAKKLKKSYSESIYYNKNIQNILELN